MNENLNNVCDCDYEEIRSRLQNDIQHAEWTYNAVKLRAKADWGFWVVSKVILIAGVLTAKYVPDLLHKLATALQ